MDEFNIALPLDGNLQRQLAKRIRAEKPVEILMVTGNIYAGWISGIDEDSIQLCLVDSLGMQIVMRGHIESIGDYKLSGDLPDWKKQDLREFTKRMQQQATQALGVKR